MGIKLWGTQISTPVLSCACLLLFLIVFQVFLEYFDDEDVVHYHYYGPTTSRSAAAAGATTGGGGGGMTARAAGMRPGYDSKAGIHAHQGGAGELTFPFFFALFTSTSPEAPPPKKNKAVIFHTHRCPSFFFPPSSQRPGLLQIW